MKNRILSIMDTGRKKAGIIILCSIMILAIGSGALIHVSALSDNNTRMSQTHNEQSIEELGATIVEAGRFWEQWWGMNGMFTWEHIGNIPWEEWDELPEHLSSGGFGRLLPTSGFESIQDVHNYLLQYYTEAWIASELLFFYEYEDILYMHTARAGFPYPNWETATHTLIEQEGDRAVVETTVLIGTYNCWYSEYGEPWETQLRFTFVDGRIDSGWRWDWGSW